MGITNLTSLVNLKISGLGERSWPTFRRLTNRLQYRAYTRLIQDRLSPELIASILRHLSPLSYAEVFEYESSYNYKGPAQISVTEGQRHLVQAIRVCRVWGTASRELLYTQPFLSSLKQAQLFARTMESSPALAAFVKGILILSPTVKMKKFSFSSVKNEVAEQDMRKELTRVLNACPSSSSLTIVNRNGSYTPLFPLDWTFVEGSAVFDMLRNLTIYGTAAADSYPPLDFDIFSAYTCLPYLEVLCLREVPICSKFCLPSLPRLHTLRIAQCGRWRSTEVDVITISSLTLPSLWTLELYQNKFRVCLEDELLHRLGHLYLLGSMECHMFSNWSSHPLTSLESLRHFAYGTFWFPWTPQYNSMTDNIKQLPSGIETLTVLVRIMRTSDHAFYGHPWTFDTGILKSLIRCLKSDTIPKSLREVVLMKMSPSKLRISDVVSMTLKC